MNMPPGQVTSPAPARQEPATDPDSDLVDRVRRGDLCGALQALMERHGTAVYSYASHMLGDAALAEDVRQQIFVEALRDLPGFGARSTLRSWLFAIAHHRVLDAVAARKRAQARTGEAPDDDLLDPGAAPDELLDDAELRAALVASVAELPGKARTAVLLRYHHGFSFEEMAAICGERPGALQMRVARALPVLHASIMLRTGGRLRGV